MARLLPRLEHAPFPKVIRLLRGKSLARIRLEHAPFPKVIRSSNQTKLNVSSLEHAPFPKVIRYVRTEKPL